MDSNTLKSTLVQVMTWCRESRAIIRVFVYQQYLCHHMAFLVAHSDQCIHYQTGNLFSWNLSKCHENMICNNISSTCYFRSHSNGIKQEDVLTHSDASFVMLWPLPIDLLSGSPHGSVVLTPSFRFATTTNNEIMKMSIFAQSFSRKNSRQWWFHNLK